MTCHEHIWGGNDGLSCDRTDEHATGHTYSSTKPDEHSDGSDQ